MCKRSCRICEFLVRLCGESGYSLNELPAAINSFVVIRFYLIQTCSARNYLPGASHLILLTTRF